jgi:hypothetical protein
LIGKEAEIERSMWMAVYAYEELVSIVQNLSTRNGPDRLPDDHYRDRIERAEKTARSLRMLIDQDRALRLREPPGD